MNQGQDRYRQRCEVRAWIDGPQQGGCSVIFSKEANSSVEREEGRESWRPHRKADINNFLCNSQNIQAERDLKNNLIEFFPCLHFTNEEMREKANLFHKGPERRYFRLCGP